MGYITHLKCSMHMNDITGGALRMTVTQGNNEPSIISKSLDVGLFIIVASGHSHTTARAFAVFQSYSMARKRRNSEAIEEQNAQSEGLEQTRPGRRQEQQAEIARRYVLRSDSCKNII